jgi:hypothetical protein
VRRERNEVAQGGVSHSQAGTHYEVIDSEELARRWVLPVSWVREHVRSRVTDPIPHIRFGRYVRFRWGSSELEGWLAEHMVNSSCASQTNAVIMPGEGSIPLTLTLTLPFHPYEANSLGPVDGFFSISSG